MELRSWEGFKQRRGIKTELGSAKSRAWRKKEVVKEPEGAIHEIEENPTKCWVSWTTMRRAENMLLTVTWNESWELIMGCSNRRSHVTLIRVMSTVMWGQNMAGVAIWKKGRWESGERCAVTSFEKVYSKWEQGRWVAISWVNGSRAVGSGCWFQDGRGMSIFWCLKGEDSSFLQ